MKPFDITKNHVIAVTLIVSFVFLTGGYVYYSMEERSIHATKQREIKSIAELKANIVSQWYHQKTGQSLVITRSPFFVRAAEEWLNHRGDPAFESSLRPHLLLPKMQFGFEEIILTSPAGSRLFELDSSMVFSDEEISRGVAAIERRPGGANAGEFYYCSTHHKVHYDIVAPVRDEKGKTIALLFCREDPAAFLFPLLQEWPASGKSSETILVRKDGDSVLYLNDIGYRSKSPASFRVPLTATQLPAVQAVNGREGIVFGANYRNAEVIAYILPVVETPWYLVVQIDHDELFSDIMYRSIVAFVITIGSIVLALTMLAYVYRSRQQSILRSLFNKEKELRERQEEFQKILYRNKERLDRGEAVSRSGNWELDLEHMIVTTSDGGKRIYGLTGEQWTADEIRNIAIPEDRERLAQAIRNLIEHGAQYDITFRIRHQITGKLIDIHSLARFDQENKTVYGIIQDITERKKVDEKLRQLSRSVEQSPSSIVITNTDGVIEYVNPKCTEITGYSSAELIGKNPRILKSGKTPPDEYERLWQTIGAGGEWRGEFKNRKKTGELFWEATSITPIFDDDGKITHYLAIKEDVTERKRLEQQLIQSQKLEGLGTLAGGIAHDFNNLLAMILGSAELLQSRMADQPELRKFVNRIIDASLRGTSISRQLLTFSRPNETDLKPVSLSQMLTEAKELLAHFLPKAITIHTSLGVDNDIIMGDEGQIHQAILNLAINAGDAMAQKGTLSIREYRVDSADMPPKFGRHTAASFLAVKVADTGKGMDAATLQKIFDPFFTTKEKGKGTGLGLSNVHGIMKNHDGFIDVESVPGRGTAFTLYFPCASVQLDVRIPAVAGSHLPEEETILVVDDEVYIREMLSEYLTGAGYRVITASDGQEALLVYKRERSSIRMVITDLGMPKMGGEELFRRLIAIDASVKVIASSGYLDKTTKSELRTIGFKEILTKPYKLQEIKSVVQCVLSVQ